MQLLIYALSAITILLAIGGIAAWASTRAPVLLLSSVVSIVAAIWAITTVSLWPLLGSLAVNAMLAQSFKRY